MHLRLGQATRHDAQDQTSRHRSRRCRLHAQSHRLQSRAHSQAHRCLRRSLPASRKTGSDRPKSNNKGRKRLGYRGFFSKLQRKGSPDTKAPAIDLILVTANSAVRSCGAHARAYAPGVIADRMPVSHLSGFAVEDNISIRGADLGVTNEIMDQMAVFSESIRRLEKWSGFRAKRQLKRKIGLVAD